MKVNGVNITEDEIEVIFNAFKSVGVGYKLSGIKGDKVRLIINGKKSDVIRDVVYEKFVAITGGSTHANRRIGRASTDNEGTSEQA
jgi:hypothetical protein